LALRLREWRDRRNERKAEKLAFDPKEAAEAESVRRDYINRQVDSGGLGTGFIKHAGDEGRNHY
jgi:hypothetical protein